MSPKKAGTVIAFLVVFAPSPAGGQDGTVFEPALKALDSKLGRAEAFSRFVAIVQIADPHPDREVQGMLDRAKRGDRNAFALVAWFVWRGYPGLRQDRLAGEVRAHARTERRQF